MATENKVLDELLDTLGEIKGSSASASLASEDGPEATLPTPSSDADAIDRELAQTARTTSVQSLRDSPTVREFRQAIMDGMIRVDTVNRLLRLINEWILLAGRS